MTKQKIYAAQGTLASLSAYLSDKFGLLYPALLLLIAMMGLDFLSGWAASAKEAIENPTDKEKGLSSKKCLLGIFKKSACILVIIVGFAIDWVAMEFAKYIGVSIDSATFFGLLTTSWFILNELLSLVENAGRMGAKIPKFLKSIVAVLKDKVEDSGESIVEAVEEIVEEKKENIK